MQQVRTKNYETWCPFFMEPTVEKDEFGEVVRSGFIPTAKRCIFLWSAKIIRAFFWLQGMEIRLPEPTGLKYIDHMVGNVGWNEMNTWVKFYEEVMGFVNFLSLMTNKSIPNTLMSKVMSNGNGRIKFPINEPAEGKKKSQIEEYLDFMADLEFSISLLQQMILSKRYRN
jgi:4-hydroxyphenylpyruvate dioxygenase